MSTIFGKSHRKFQDLFEARKLADRVEDITVKQEFDDDVRDFISSRDMFFFINNRSYWKTNGVLQRWRCRLC